MKKIILSSSFILFCLLAVGVRIFELLVMIDKQSGFYLNKFNIISIILAIISLIVCVNFGIGAVVSLKGESKDRRIPKNSIAIGISSFLMALGIFYDTGKIALNTTEYSLGNYIVFGLSFLSTLTFIIYGVCYFAGKNSPKTISIIPIIWSVGRLIVNYTQFNGIALASENIVDLITIAFFMVFWLYHSKLLVELNTEKTLTRIFIFGSCATALGFVSTFPRFFVDFGLRVDFISTSPMVSFSNLTAAIYAVCFMGVLYLQTVEKSVISTPIETSEDMDVSVDSHPQFTVEVIDDFTVEENKAEEDN